MKSHEKAERLHEHLKSLKVTNDKSTLAWQKHRNIKGDYQSLDHCGKDRSSYSAEKKIKRNLLKCLEAKWRLRIFNCVLHFVFVFVFQPYVFKIYSKEVQEISEHLLPYKQTKKNVLKIILSLKITYKRELLRLLRVQRHNDCSQKLISLTRDGKEMVALIVKTVRFKYASRITLCIITNVDGTCLHKIF